MKKHHRTATEINQLNATQTSYSILGQALAEKRAEAINHHAAQHSPSNGSFIIMIAFMLLIQAFACGTVSSFVARGEMGDDISAQWSIMPEYEPATAESVQPDYGVRQLIPPPPNQLGEQLILGQPHGIHLRGIEITQGIQVFNEPEDPRCQPNPQDEANIFCNNAVPLVAGRHTMVRVYVGCDGSCPTNDRFIHLTIKKDGLERGHYSKHLSAGKLNQLNTLPIPEMRLDLEQSINFEFMPPPDWLSGQVTLEFTTSPVSLHLNQRRERAPLGEITTEFTPRKALRIAYLPIQYQGKTPEMLDTAPYWLTRMYPVPKVEYYRLPVPDLVWEGELNKNDILQKLLYTYWLYAIYHPPQTWPDQLFGWLPQEYYNGGASDPYWCPYCAGPHSSRVGFGGVRPELDIGGARILVHEIAHNLGAQHAWSPTQAQDAACFRGEGVDIQVDPTWPYPDTPLTQEVGIDLYSTPPIIYGTTEYDMMAYCAQPWISPYTYRTLFDSPFLNPTPNNVLPLSDYRPHLESGGNGALLVSGVVYPDGTVSEPEIIQLEGEMAATLATNFSPPSIGDYCVTVRSRAAEIIGEQCFDVGFINIETGLPTEEASSFFVSLPNIPAEIAGEVILSKNGQSLKTIQASSHAPEINLLTPFAGDTVTGQVSVEWTAQDGDGDTLFFDILYSPDAGGSWLPLAVRLTSNSYRFHTSQLPPTEQGLLRVVATDGFHNATAETTTPFQINHQQENSISIDGPMSVVPQEQFTVTVKGHNLSNPGLVQTDFEFHVDPDFLQVEAIDLHATWSNNKVTIDNKTGIVTVHTTASPTALINDQVLATITLRSTPQYGFTQLYLREFKARFPNKTVIPVQEMWELSLHVVN